MVPATPAKSVVVPLDGMTWANNRSMVKAATATAMVTWVVLGAKVLPFSEGSEPGGFDRVLKIAMAQPAVRGQPRESALDPPTRVDGDELLAGWVLDDIDPRPQPGGTFGQALVAESNDDTTLSRRLVSRARRSSR